MKDCQVSPNTCTPLPRKSGKPPPGGAKTLQALVHFSLADLSPLPGFSVFPKDCLPSYKLTQKPHIKPGAVSAFTHLCSTDLRPKRCFKMDVLGFHSYFCTFSRFPHPLSFLFGIILFWLLFILVPHLMNCKCPLIWQQSSRRCL